jgi:hypothetical protein
VYCPAGKVAKPAPLINVAVQKVPLLKLIDTVELEVQAAYPLEPGEYEAYFTVYIIVEGVIEGVLLGVCVTVGVGV